MARTSLVHYIAPSAISITPNCNSSVSDLAVYVARGAKIKVNSKKAGIDTAGGSYQEWVLTGRNRRLADSTVPYTIYARLRKTDKTDGYLMFVPQQQVSGEWKDKYPYVTTDGLYRDVYGSESSDYYYVRLGDVTLPGADGREVILDTGILGTEQYNEEWNLNPDNMPINVGINCTIDDEDAGPTPYVQFGKILVLTASLQEGWADTDVERFDHWEIIRNSGDAESDANWPDAQRAALFAETGVIELTHSRSSDDDFNGAVSGIYTVIAWGTGDPYSSGNPSYVQIASASISIMAETVEKYDLSLSASIVSYSPQTGAYTPAGGVDVRVRATDQRGDVFNLSNGQITNARLSASYAPVDTSDWTPLTFSGASGAEAVANIPVSAFANQQSLKIRLMRIIDPATSEQMEMTTGTVAFVRDGEDSKEREWIFQHTLTVTTYGDEHSEHPRPSVIDGGEVKPSGVAGGDDHNKDQDGWVPEGWCDNPQGIDETYQFEYASFRDFIHSDSSGADAGGHWGDFSEPSIWNHYAGDAVTYDIVPSVSVINADAAGTVDSDGIIVRAYQTKGSERSDNILPSSDYPEEGDYYLAEYSIDGGTWQRCSKFDYPAGETTIPVYGVPAAAVKTATEQLALRLKHSSDTSVVLKENAPIKVVKIITEEEVEDVVENVGGNLFLSKTNDDEAAGIITFLKGLVFKGLLKSFGAREGFMDGVGIIMNALEGLIETDGLNVRGFMRVMELIINRLQLMESDYSFTEGDTVEHIAYEDEGQTLVLTMHKDHDNDYTPFYPGDIIYGIVNDLLPHDSQLPDGHIKTSNGSYYHTWMRVKSVDLTQNKLRVAIYQGKRISGYDEHGAPIYEPIVPGGTNFSPYGTAITTDVATPMQQEMQQIGAEGYDIMLEVTRHGNVADGIDPETGQYSPSIYQSQKGRQQAWVLSTTDKRLSFFWNVDTPIVRDENYALCLGILPDLANLPTTRNKEMPSLYVNTIFYDHHDRANYPAKVEKVDRGEWRQTPYETYTDPYSGTYTPDGTLDATDPDLADYVALVPIINGWAGTYTSGQEVQEPYHYRSFTKCQWLRYRLDTLGYGSLTDKTLLLKMMKEWTEEVSLQTSRVWNNGKLWECTVDYTSQEPRLGCTDWLVVSGNMLWTMGFASTNGNAFYQGHVQTTVTAHLYWGDEDVTAIVGAAAFDWTRSSESGKTAADEAWDADTAHQGTNRLDLTDNDMPTAWSRNNKAIFTCTATTTYGGEQVIIQNQIIA